VRYQDALDMLNPLGISFLYDKGLKLYLLVLDETVVYLEPQEFRDFDLPNMKTWVARNLIEYTKSQPIITFH
jgi:hypothetical protein